MSEHAELYEALLRQLHALDVAGLGDSVEAEAVCEQMDGPWHRMAEDEQRAMRLLSARLNRGEE